MLDPKALGLPTAKPTDDSPVPEPVDLAARPARLVPGSVTAQVLRRVWAGAEITVVDSPPGAGKTELVVTVVAHLTASAGLRVLIVTPTRAQAALLACRLVAQIDPANIEVAIKNMPLGSLPHGLCAGSRSGKIKTSRVTVRTLASASARAPEGFDVMVVDEAYQATFAEVASAAAQTGQVLMVGDPGQIGPVVTVNTSIWESMRAAPHRQAPVVFKSMDGAETLSLSQTWRLGPVSTAAVAPLYDFPFHSARPPRSLVTADGEVVPEIFAIEVPVSANPDDMVTLRAVADRAASLIGSTLTGPGGDPDPSDVRWNADQADVTVVVSRNSQVSIVSGLLAEQGLAEITVGTADRLQGGQWPVVVALDPGCGVSEGSDHSMSIGRLCVMISRHTTHLSWVHDRAWPSQTAGRGPNAVKGRAVRKNLTVGTVPTSTLCAALSGAA